MGHDAHTSGVHRATKDVTLMQSIDQLRRGQPILTKSEDDNIGLNLLWIEPNSGNLGQSTRENLSIFVIRSEQLWPVLQRHQTRGAKHSDLTHAAAQHLANHAVTLNEIP